MTGFRAAQVERDAQGGVILVSEEGGRLAAADEVIVTTGSRPDLSLLSELRLGLAPSVEAPRVLAPMIDPNLHSCGAVRPHGARELSHPEKGFYIAGMKSYGRAPTFLLLTGYEQVRSIVCQLTGDEGGAREVRLELPETGVCRLNRSSGEGSGDDAGDACYGAPPGAAAPTDPAGSGCGDSCQVTAPAAKPRTPRTPRTPTPKAVCCG